MVTGFEPTWIDGFAAAHKRSRPPDDSGWVQDLWK